MNRRFSRLFVLCTLFLLLSASFFSQVQPVAASTFTNSSGITINDNTTASPYPSSISVAGMPIVITDVDVTLTGITHNFPDDMDIALKSPSGTVIILLSDSGGNATGSISNVNLTFDQSAASQTPNGITIVSGTYQPVNYGAGDTFSGVTPVGTSLDSFNNTNPNGTWELYVVDDAAGNTGSIASWSLSITSTVPAVSIAAQDANGAEAGLDTAAFRFSRTGPTTSALTVQYTINSGSTASAADYTPVLTGSIIIPAGQSFVDLTITPVDDALDEVNNETITIDLTDTVTYDLLQSSALVRIADDDNPPTISIANASVIEGNAGQKNITFTVTLSAVSGRRVQVDYATADVDATAGVDYSTTSGTVAVLAGDISNTFTIPVLGDVIDEPNETFTVTLSNPTNATIDIGTGTGTIEDNDNPPTVSIDNVTINEGNTGETPTMTFTVTLNNPSAFTSTVDYATANGTATVGSDYSSASGTLTFIPGDTEETLTVTILGDALNENNEYFDVDLSNLINMTAGDLQGRGTITNDDPEPTISINDVSINETDAGTPNLSFTVSLSEPSGRSIFVSYETADDTAAAGVDYTAVPLTQIVFPVGTTTRTVHVEVLGDLVDEPDETVLVNLSNPIRASILDSQGVGTILDDEPTPNLHIQNVTLNEGNPGETPTMTFTVGLNIASSQTITVDYATQDNTADAGIDYTAASGTLTFAPGDTEETFNVTILGDALNEVNENFFVNLTNPTNATTNDPQARGIITNDDPEPTISIDDVSVGETNVGTPDLVFTLSLNAPSGRRITVDYTTADDTAVQPGDYTSRTGQVVFVPGDTQQTLRIEVIGDILDEPDETLFVNLNTPTNATIADAQGLGTIIDNDPTPNLHIQNVNLAEGNSGTTDFVFTVTLNTPSGRTVQVNYVTADDTAVAGVDYNSTSGTLTFAPGDTEESFTVLVNGDTLNEINDHFFVNLSGEVNADLIDSQAVGIIANDDAPAAISIDDANVNEGNTGETPTMTFTVRLDVPSGRRVEVNYATVDGSALAGIDYTSTSGMVFIPPGDTETTFTVPVIGNAIDQNDRAFTVSLNTPVNATITDADAIGTINDDDNPPGVSINDASVSEGNTGDAPTMTFTVTLSTASALPITVDYATSDNDAAAGTDYNAASNTLTFAPGDTEESFTVSMIGDVIDEDNETFTVTLSNPSNVTLGDATGTGTINDDDSANITVDPVSGLITAETGSTAAFTVGLNTQPSADVTVSVTSMNTAEGVVDLPFLTFTHDTWNIPQTVTITGQDDAIADGSVPYTIQLGIAVSADAKYNGIDPADVNVTNNDDDAPGLVVTPPTFMLTEGVAGSYQIRLNSVPTNGAVSVLVEFPTDQVAVNGNNAPFYLTFTDKTPQTVTFSVLATLDINSTRDIAIHHTVIGTTSIEYPIGMSQAVLINIADSPPPPPSPTCDSENANADGVVRTGIPDALAYAINCRVLYHNGGATTWLGSPLYTEGNLGVPGLLDLRVQQAVDIFSPPPSSLTYFEGGLVMCLRGEGTLIWMAASHAPRIPEIIGSYSVPEFPGFTCTSIFEPGTLVLVTENPLD